MLYERKNIEDWFCFRFYSKSVSCGGLYVCRNEDHLWNDYNRRGGQIYQSNVSFHYPNNERMILKNINLKLDCGSKIAIVGPNGAIALRVI